VPFDAVNQADDRRPLDSDGTFFSPRMEARIYAWMPDGPDGEGLFLRTSGGRLTRLPTFLELFGDRAFFRENLRLRPESAWLVDGGIGLRLRRGWLRLAGEINGFSRWVFDLIETVRDGPGLRARNFEQVRMAGAEVGLNAALKTFVELTVNYSFLDARDSTGIDGRDGKTLPGRPQHTLFVKTVLRPIPWLRVFHEYDYASTLYLDAANYKPRPPRGLHSAGIRLGPVGNQQERRALIDLLFEVRNLLDTRLVEVPLVLTDDGRAARSALVDYADYPLPGRTFLTNLQITF
jgi:outer membrane receptor protein involved in Fe transport